MNYRISICILLCLAILASGQAAAQGTYGTKVTAGDPDVGLPLSAFAAIGAAGPFPLLAPAAVTPQNTVYLSFWDIGATPGLFDSQDVVYLQFGSSISAPGRFVRTNNIRITGWGSYPAGSYVKAENADMGQQVLPWIPGAPYGGASFAFVEVDGILGYSPGDQVYLSIAIPLPTVSTGDVRITPVGSFPAGSRVSNADPDAGSPLIPFYAPILLAAPTAGPAAPLAGPVGNLQFFNANGNTIGPAAIYDDGDVVYFDVNPINTVSPGDLRLY